MPDAAFFDRPVLDVARDLIGWTVRHGETAGRIVETEAYHESEPACHAFNGRTPRCETLFGAPGTAYVYRSYGIHALMNAVCEREGIGAAVLIRALEPVDGIATMHARRGRARITDLCSGPGKLTQALGVRLDHDASSLVVPGPIVLEAPLTTTPIVTGTRIGITKAIELEWRFCDPASAHVSRPLPDVMRRGRLSRAGR